MIEIFPLWIVYFDSIHLIFSLPFFDALLCSNSIIYIFEGFIPYKLMNFVFFGESIIEICFVFLYPPDQIIRHSYIECSVASTGKYVSIVSKHRGTLVVLDSCIRRNDRNAVGYRVTLFAFFFPISTSVPSPGKIQTLNLESFTVTPFIRTELPHNAFLTSQLVAQNQSNFRSVPILIVPSEML